MPQEMSQPQTASRIFSEIWDFSKHSLRPVCCRATSEGDCEERCPGKTRLCAWGRQEAALGPPAQVFPRLLRFILLPSQIVTDYVTYKQQEFTRLTVPESGETRVQGLPLARTSFLQASSIDGACVEEGERVNTFLREGCSHINSTGGR